MTLSRWINPRSFFHRKSPKLEKSYPNDKNVFIKISHWRMAYFWVTWVRQPLSNDLTFNWNTLDTWLWLRNPLKIPKNPIFSTQHYSDLCLFVIQMASIIQSIRVMKIWNYARPKNQFKNYHKRVQLLLDKQTIHSRNSLQVESE